ncbi:MAG TPA: hypothetical protein VGL78_12315 [Solirubrobacteraceae bacterium]
MRRARPFQGAPPAILEINRGLVPALHRVTPGTKLIVVTWLHVADRSILQVHPMDDERLSPTVRGRGGAIPDEGRAGGGGRRPPRRSHPARRPAAIVRGQLLAARGAIPATAQRTELAACLSGRLPT